MAQLNVLLAGESWVTLSVHQKGFNLFTEGRYEEGAAPLIAALNERGISVHQIPGHKADRDFPTEAGVLKEYDVVMLSDIGSDTLLLHPDTFARSEPMPDRLELIRDYVEGGGGFLMVGGYLSFQGYGGSAHYRYTPVEEILPVSLMEGDDRIERPAGFVPEPAGSHPITDGLPGPWPRLLGYNKVKPEAQVVIRTDRDDPLLVVGEYGKGRTAAFTSDCSPHWGSPEFVAWQGYGELWSRLISWLAGKL
jgi:uncharacterized membrane protein